jgi:RES domain
VTPTLHRAELPDRVYRLGREPDPWEWPDWSYASPDGTFGNRFDDPEGQYRVLYASAEPETTFRECLARFRPDPAIVAIEIVENDDDENSPRRLPAGRVALSWLQNRCIGTGRLIGEFCDIGHSASIVHFRAAFAARLTEYGLDDLDAGDVRLRVPRALTQEISHYIFEQTDQERPAYAGIRYGSRLGDDLTNWAIFEPNEPVDCEQEEIEPDDPDLVHVLEDYGLTLD